MGSICGGPESREAPFDKISQKNAHISYFAFWGIKSVFLGLDIIWIIRSEYEKW